MKLHGFCAHAQESSLVYEYLEREEAYIAKILSSVEQPKELDWIRRIDVGLPMLSTYNMHHNFTSPIIHQDLFSKNILLDLHYEAHISDFDMVIIRQLLKS